MSWFYMSFTACAGVVINEIMASNGSTIADEDGDYEDWIELYHAGDSPVDLSGWGLTDDPDTPYQWVFPSMTMHPGDFLLVFASGKDRRETSNGVYDSNWPAWFPDAAGMWLQVDDGHVVALDASKHQNHGRLYGPSQVRWGKHGGALTFDNIRHSVEIENIEALQITNDMTISMWLYPASVGAGRQNPMEKALGGEGTITLAVNGQLSYYWGQSGSNLQPYQGFHSVAALSQDRWTHAVLVRDLEAQRLQWYFNGVRVAESAAAFDAAVASDRWLRLGRGYAGAFEGLISKVVLLPRALSSGQVKELYAAQQAAFRNRLHTNFRIGQPGDGCVSRRKPAKVGTSLPG